MRQNELRFSDEVIQSLNEAGWHDGRNVDITAYVEGSELFPAARVVLREFVGLHIGRCGPGIECATSDLQVDPRLAAQLALELERLRRNTGAQFFVLGDLHQSHGYLLIDENGGIYLLDDELVPFAHTFDEALEKLIMGFKPESGLPPRGNQ